MLSKITGFNEVTPHVGQVHFSNGCCVQISITDFIDENIKKLESRVDELTKDNASLIFESKNNEARIKNLTKNYTAMKDLYEGANFRNMELAKELEEASKKSDFLNDCINHKNKVIEDLFNDNKKLKNMLEKYEKGCPIVVDANTFVTADVTAKVPSNDAVDAFRYSLDNLKKGCEFTCEIEMTRIDWARIHAAGISEVMENPFTDLEFSDHKTLNAFFKEYFKVSRWTRDGNSTHVSKNNDFDNMIEALEECMDIFNDQGIVSLAGLFYEWNDSGNIGELQSEEDEELSRYRWNNEHPFSYTIMSCKGEEDDSLMQYYVVFNSAPEYIEDDEDED